MTWIRVDTTLVRHPKVARLAQALGMGRHEAVGVLIDLWTWSVDYTEGGDLSRITGDDLMAALGVSQEALIPVNLIEALVGSGFVDRDDERLVLHDWDVHQGQLLAQREANRERQRRRRERVRGDTRDTLDRHAHVTRTSRVRHGATERNATLRNDTRRNERRETDNGVAAAPPASVLSFGDLQPVMPAHLDRWRPLFPALDIGIELESMRAYLAAAPASRRPKRSLPKFAINWLKRAARERLGDQRGDAREERAAQRRKEGADQVAGIAATAPLSSEAISAARKVTARMFTSRGGDDG